jgi:cytochrome c oxidase assembly protein subunit 15
MPKNASTPSTAVLTVFRLAALFTFLAVAMGAVVCATGSGASCPTWPGCRPDQITPQWQLSPLIEFTHRVVAMSAGPLVLAAAVMSRGLTGPNRWVRILPWVALVGALAAGAFGRLAVLSGLPTWLGGVDLFSALTAMTVMGVSAVMVSTTAPDPSSPSSPASAQRHSPDLVLSLGSVTLTVLVAIHVSGIFVAGKLSYTRCIGWPIWQLIDTDRYPWLQGLRLGLAGLGAVLVITTAVVAARSERLRRWGIAAATLFAAEMVLGLVIRAGGINAVVAAAYSLLAVALLSCLGLLTAVAWSARVATDATPQQPAPTREPVQPGRR